MRRTVRLAMRALAERGIGSLLPDLPGQNESLVPTADVSLHIWADALRQISEQEKRPLVSASIRGGALIDQHSAVAAVWRLAPVKGANLLKSMMTARIASDKEAGQPVSRDMLIAEAASVPLQLAGNWLSSDMIRELESASPAPLSSMREVRLGASGAPDEITGTPLWLRAEPGEDAAMAYAIAQDIADWMHTCGVI